VLPFGRRIGTFFHLFREPDLTRAESYFERLVSTPIWAYSGTHPAFLGLMIQATVLAVITANIGRSVLRPYD
jgi:hypothetical protein